MVLGLGGLTNGWRTVSRVWAWPAFVGDGLAWLTVLVFVSCGVAFMAKWMHSRERAIAEWTDPMLGSFVVLVPMATMVTSLALRIALPQIAWGLCIVGMVGQVVVGIWGTGSLWRGGREPRTITSVLLMPTVGGCFVSALGAGTFGQPDLGWLFFGAGFLSWMVIESVVLQRLLSEPLPAAQRSTLGIHVTPPAIACVAYLSITQSEPDRFAQMLFGYALLQALVVVRLVPWLREQSFGLAIWAYTFGLSALALGALRCIELGHRGPIAWLAVPLFVVANLVIGWIAFGTLALALRGRLFPPKDRDPSRSFVPPSSLPNRRANAQKARSSEAQRNSR